MTTAAKIYSPTPLLFTSSNLYGLWLGELCVLPWCLRAVAISGRAHRLINYDLSWKGFGANAKCLEFLVEVEIGHS